jgi:hypothetical protein
MFKENRFTIARGTAQDTRNILLDANHERLKLRQSWYNINVGKSLWLGMRMSVKEGQPDLAEHWVDVMVQAVLSWGRARNQGEKAVHFLSVPL